MQTKNILVMSLLLFAAISCSKKQTHTTPQFIVEKVNDVLFPNFYMKELSRK
jgi:hypothetical protein